MSLHWAVGEGGAVWCGRGRGRGRGRGAAVVVEEYNMYYTNYGSLTSPEKLLSTMMRTCGAISCSASAGFSNTLK